MIITNEQPACIGLRVLEVADGFNSGSLCGQLFAGLGAEVVKLERGMGDPLRTKEPLASDGVGYAFHLTNAGKQSALLGSGSGEWDRLIDWADIVVLDRDTAIAGFDLDPKRLSQQHPAKIICVVGSFGMTGARARWRGTELLIEAMGGLMACTGYPELPPVMSGVPYADHVAAMFAFGGIMAAIFERTRSGLGQLVEISAADCLVALLGNFMPGYFLSGRSPKRIGNRHTIAAPWNLYPAADGSVVICTGTGGTSWWRIITRIIGRSELAESPLFDSEAKRVERVEEVDGIISEWAKTRPMQDIVATMSGQGIPCSEIATIADVIADRQYTETRAMIVAVGHGADAVRIPGLPLKVGAWKPPAVAGPELGSFHHAGSRSAAPEPARGRPDRSALDGIRVLEFASRTSVPMAGRLLADLGADVVKIEPKKGESLRGAGQQIGGSSYLFQINNGGKRSVVIEPGTESGRKLILDLAAKADVWMENLAPGTLQKMSLGYEDLRRVNPRIIYCSVSGFGLKSDHGNKKALDTVVQAASGIMSVTGYPDHLPVKLGISAVDLAVAVGLLGTVTSALYARERTQKGQHIDLAMADLGVWMTQSAWPSIVLDRKPPQRMGNRGAEFCPHNLFATDDGFLALAVGNDEQWSGLVKVVGTAKLADRAFASAKQRLAQIELVEHSVGEWLRTQKTAAVAQQLQSLGIAAAPLRSLADIVADPELTERGLIVSLEHPIAGPIRLLGTPLNLSRTAAKLRRYAPVLGEHTREVLSEWLNANERDITRLAAEGSIGLQAVSAQESKGAELAVEGARP